MENEVKSLQQVMNNLGTSLKQAPENIREISLYSGSLDNNIIAYQLKRLQIAFPEMKPDFIKLLTDRIHENNFTNQRLIDSVDNIIDNFHYKSINIADIISWDKKVKIYTHQEIADKDQGFDNYIAIDLGIDKPRWIDKAYFNNSFKKWESK